MINKDNVNRERVEEWVAELESGRHPQVCGTLRTNSNGDGGGGAHHCALGIAMLVAERAGVTVESWQWFGAGLPRGVREWFGFECSDIVVTREDGSLDLVSTISDSHGAESQGIFWPDSQTNFWEIAQLLRATYLKDDGS